HRIPIHPALMGDLQSFSEIRKRLFKLYQEIQPDLVHLHTTGPSLFLEMQTHSTFDIPRFLTFHAFFSYPPKTDGYLLRYLPKLDFLSGVSQRMLDMALNLFPQNPPPHRVIYNGLPDPISMPTPAPVTKEILLSLGRLSKEKGVDLAIQAFH